MGVLMFMILEADNKREWVHCSKFASAFITRGKGPWMTDCKVIDSCVLVSVHSLFMIVCALLRDNWCANCYSLPTPGPKQSPGCTRSSPSIPWGQEAADLRSKFEVWSQARLTFWSPGKMDKWRCSRLSFIVSWLAMLLLKCTEICLSVCLVLDIDANTDWGLPGVLISLYSCGHME